jgi:hypothetical protein
MSPELERLLAALYERDTSQLFPNCPLPADF